MGMNVGSESTTEDEGIVDINTTPLIDVMLVLLIMLIITIPLQTHSVSMDLPQGNPPPQTTPDPRVVTVGIDFDNTITWNGAPVTNEAELQTRFREAAAEQPEQPEMHISPNRLADYKTVVHVLADAQRLGITRLGIVGQDQFTDGD
ncbi:ExbD/TolR proton channel family protein [Acetobacter estunensis NRIC 0472]|uniref:Biopolymer transporter ExbD n=1 Tax=Acetobacter estunensis TaxID=104097 RepID=A0A967B4V8_9PROT|nr:biopolymer transporter ExbD [Acetobacter estunensis]MBV1837740.1 biopolymer transporter ExbD [Acetobacter estunensis]NHO53802.1 biopolymer transporter ExbD [Acetobacter estunensis]GBQ20012.1 ExbD/TolR proton channel family protein [Acetobacter estunensis NRIC 0472]